MRIYSVPGPKSRARRKACSLGKIDIRQLTYDNIV